MQVQDTLGASMPSTAGIKGTWSGYMYAKYPGQIYKFLLLGKPSLRRSSRSPSASHLLAFTSWTTLMNCFPAMTGKDMEARIHGTVESILFALYFQNTQSVSAHQIRLVRSGNIVYARERFGVVRISEDVPCHLHCAC